MSIGGDLVRFLAVFGSCLCVHYGSGLSTEFLLLDLTMCLLELPFDLIRDLEIRSWLSFMHTHCFVLSSVPSSFIIYNLLWCGLSFSRDACVLLQISKHIWNQHISSCSRLYCFMYFFCLVEAGFGVDTDFIDAFRLSRG